jgi:GT2 family glycosyltransferase
MTVLVPRTTGEHGPEPVISVAVPVLDGGELLLDLLAAVESQQVRRGPVEILLADSGSGDGAVEEALARWPAVRVFDVQGGFDHGLARSALVRAARAPLVALLSQDAVPRGRRYLESLAAPFEAADLAGAHARQVPRRGADPLLRATLARWTPPPAVVGVRPRVRRFSEAELRELAPAERIAAARFDNVASMVRRSVVLDLPFPPRPFGEDLAWGAAALRAGLALAYVPTAVVEHDHRPGLRGTYERHRAAHHQAAAEFGLQAVPSLRAGARALLAGVPGDLRDGGPRWALRGLPRRAAALLGQWAGARHAGRLLLPPEGSR